MENNSTKILRSVAVNLDTDEVTKLIKKHLEKEGFEVRNVDFKVSERLVEGYGAENTKVLSFDGCTVACRLITERSED